MPALSPSACARALPKTDADVLDRVMRVDVQVALALHAEVEQAVLGQVRQHVVEEANAGGDLGPCPCRRDSSDRLDVGLVGRSVDRDGVAWCSVGPLGRTLSSEE